MTVSRLGGVSARTPLRVRLVAALLALVALALLVAGVAGTAALRTYLLDRVDDQLRATPYGEVERLGRGAPPPGFGDRRGGRLRLPGDLFVQVDAADGTTLAQPSRGEQVPALPRMTYQEAAARGSRPFTVDSAGGDGPRWRVLVTPLRDGSGSVAVGLSLADVDATVARLALIQLVVGLVVLALLAGLASAVVRSSLRPLVEVEQTAGAIAAGDLSRRVPDHHPRTEIGRLSRALNGMLAQIEAAFRDRAASEAAARASEERMRRFVADASHELRTPLTSIRGFAELYRQGAAPEPADAARILRRIEDEARRMGLLVDDLLLLARLDQQRPLDRRPVDLLALAADAVHDAVAVAPQRSIELRVLEGDTAPVVLGDEARLRQVLSNLVTNALTHTPPGTTITLTVGTGTDPAGGRVAVLEVADTGPGLRPEDAARVFERFYRADDSRTRSSGGSGLGLSIVSALVAAHGGEVDLTTEPGRGARFQVRLPLPEERGRGASRVDERAPVDS